MKSYCSIIWLLLAIICNSCVETLSDEVNEYSLSDGGKKMDIYIPEGVSIVQQTKDVELSKIEELVISGHISGDNLSLLRDLSGGNDIHFLGGRNLKTINMENLFFYQSLEVYYTREKVKFTVPAGNNIPSYAFENCYVLQKVILPDTFGTYSINQGAFANCLLLEEIVWGKHVKNIKEKAFYNCSSLANKNKLELPKGLVTIGDSAFANVHPKDVMLPSTVKKIGGHAFSSVIGNVYLYAVNPPSIESNSFVFHEKSERILFVPYAALENYKIEPYISVFSSIQPFAEGN